MTPTTDEAAHGPPARSSLALTVVLLAAALATVGPALLGTFEGVPLVGRATEDLPGSLWLDAWTATQPLQALFSGHSAAIYWPIGADAMTLAGGPLPGILSIPFQWAFGFPNYWTPFVLAALVTNGLAAAWLARVLGAGGAGPWLAGLAFCMAPPLIREVGTGAQHIFWAAPFPIAVGLGMRAVAGGPKDAWLAGVALGCALLWWWPAAVAASLFLVALAVGAGLQRPERRSPLIAQLGWMLRASIPLWALALPLLAARTTQTGSTSGWLNLPDVIQDANGARLAFVEASRHSMPIGRLVGLSGEPLTQVAALYPVVLMVTWFWFFGLRRLQWPALVAGSAILATGSWLAPAWNLSDGWLPLPLAWLEAVIPGGLVVARPERFLVFAALGQAMMLALLWPTVVGHAPSRWRVPLAGLAGLVLAAGPRLVGVTPLPIFDWSPPAWTAAIDGPGAIIGIPLGVSQAAAIWQPLHGNPVAGGPDEVSTFAHDSAYRAYFEKTDHLSPLWRVDAGGFTATSSAALRASGAGWIVVHDSAIDRLVADLGDVKTWGYPVIAQRIGDTFGPPVFEGGGVSVYRLEPPR